MFNQRRQFEIVTTSTVIYIYIYIYIYIDTHSFVIIYIYIYIYIGTYIFTNIQSTSIHGYQEKEKKTPQFSDNHISYHCLGDKEKKISGKKKKRPILSHQFKKPAPQGI